MSSGRPTVARQYASIILLIGMVSAGIAAVVSFNGDTTLALQVCAGGVTFAIMILLFGSLIVAASNKS